MISLAAQIKQDEARERAKALRFKRPMLQSLNLDNIREWLDQIEEEAADIQWHEANGTLLEAFDGNEEEEFEFKLAAAHVEACAEELREQIEQWFRRDAYDENWHREFDDCMVGLIGNRYRELGWDDYEEDYYALCGYEADLAHTEAGKRLCRKTKAELIACIGQCLGIVLAFSDLQLQHDRLMGTLEILRGGNRALLEEIKAVERMYEDDETNTSAWATIVAGLPDRIWIE